LNTTARIRKSEILMPKPCAPPAESERRHLEKDFELRVGAVEMNAELSINNAA
jgi:hypothetical protein